MSRNFELDDLPPKLRRQAEEQMRSRPRTAGPQHTTATDNVATRDVNSDAESEQKRKPSQKSDRRMLEYVFQQAVVELARVLGWLVFHTPKVRRVDGRYQTVVDFDGAGFPDLVLARDGRTLFVELKTNHGRLTHKQETWRRELVPSGNYRLWRPRDWQRIEEELKA